LRETAKDYKNRPLAWAFFRPHRTVSSKEELKGKSLAFELQLFQWRAESILVQTQVEHFIYSSNAAFFVPASFIQYLMVRRKKFKSSMSIQLRFMGTIEEPPAVENLVPVSQNTTKSTSITGSFKDDQWSNIKRNSNDKCRIPTAILLSIKAGELGASVSSFCHCGCFIAVAVLSAVNKQIATKRSYLRIYGCNT
jgi:hypothetical protein